ncbi:MAG: O-methyltransferase [Promethearchaeota archaeon]
MSKATRIVEIGTSIGYSTLWLALGVKTTQGRIISYEIEAARVAKARSNIEQAGLSNVVEVRNEDPRRAILPETDFVFLDAEKQDYIEHFKAISPKIIPGGIVVADNVFSHEEKLRPYVEYVRTISGYNSILFPIDRGLELTYKFVKKEFDAFKSLFSD